MNIKRLYVDRVLFPRGCGIKLSPIKDGYAHIFAVSFFLSLLWARLLPLQLTIKESLLIVVRFYLNKNGAKHLCWRRGILIFSVLQ